MAFPIDDAATLVELGLIYDEAVSKNKGDAQLQAITAKALIELKQVAQTDSSFEWPVIP